MFYKMVLGVSQNEEVCCLCELYSSLQVGHMIWQRKESVV